MTVHRGTTNRNDRGSSESRRRRREWLVATYRADVDLYGPDGSPATVTGFEPTGDGRLAFVAGAGDGIPACRCYRCGCLLTVDSVTVDRIKPGCMGGTYRRENIRPACAHCNSSTGGSLAAVRKAASA